MIKEEERTYCHICIRWIYQIIFYMCVYTYTHISKRGYNMCKLSFFFFFPFLAALAVYGSSWARDQIWPTASLYNTAMVMPDGSTLCAWPGIKSMPPQWLCRILNPQCCNGNSQYKLSWNYVLNLKQLFFWLQISLWTNFKKMFYQGNFGEW